MFKLTMNPVPVTAGKRRAEPVVLTNRHCEKRVEARDKLYDRKAAGLYISRTTSGMTTFNFQRWDRFTGKVRGKMIGVYNPKTFNVDHARAVVYDLCARIGAGENVFETARQEKTTKAKQGLTVDQLIEARITWMSTEEMKDDSEMRPRIETWENVARHLRNLVSPTLGKKLAVEVTPDDVAKLSNDIVEGKHGGKASVANARHMRRAVSGMYHWAAEAGRNFVPATCQPCLKLPKLPKEPPCKRVLSADEIKILWHGLNRSELPYDRRTRLALKFALTTMLRSTELLHAHRNELFDLDGPNARIDVPLRRVKKRRALQQPLSSLAVEIVKEALKGSNKQFVFASPRGDAPLERRTMAAALRGSKKTPGICELLGLAPFTPHDLRRSAATLAGDLGYSDGAIAKCLDHSTGKDEDGAIPTVTGRVYSLSKRLNQKRTVLDGVAAALREIVNGEEVSEVQAAA